MRVNLDCRPGPQDASCGTSFPNSSLGTGILEALLRESPHDFCHSNRRRETEFLENAFPSRSLGTREQTMTTDFRNANTPKAFDIAAQGQRRRRATLGNGGQPELEPCKGSTTGTLGVSWRLDDCSTLSGLPMRSLVSPGCAVERLRRKEQTPHDVRHPNWERLKPGAWGTRDGVDWGRWSSSFSLLSQPKG